MKNLKPFEVYQNEGIIKRVKVDKERAKSLVGESDRKMASVLERVEKIGIRDDNANDYIESCYDVIMFLIRAKLYLEGYSSSGQGAHEAEVSYLTELGIEEKEVRFADQLRYFRNGILYYGTKLDTEFAQMVLKFTKQMRNKFSGLKKELGLND